MTNVIFRRLNCKRLDVGANLVGIDYRIKQVILMLHMESSDVRIVGIYGIGGIGKTTIAKVLYNRLSCEFEYMSFLENIREVSNTRGLPHLQNQLLGDILDGVGSQNINNVDHGASMTNTILSSKRVFIVLDDVDNLDQLEYFLKNREWLGEGSRVIITTRNKHLLDVQEVDNLYEVEGLYFEEAYQLFSLYAFKQNLPKSDFVNLSEHAVHYCQGLPLALKVIGSLLFKKTIPQWESELHKLDREPEAKIYNVLKRSYDGLDRTEKNIFLDIACFFKDKDRYFVSRILDGCNFYAERGIKNLNDMCLITIPYSQIHMHDLIQQMGWEIVREKFPDEPNKWSRLWDPLDIERAFRTYEGIKRVETISLDISKLKRVHFNSKVFAKMTRLRLLTIHSGVYVNYDYEDIEEEEEEEEYYDVVMKNVSKMQFSPNFKFPSDELRYLNWEGYPLDLLPSNFNGANLVELQLKCSNIKQLWQGNKSFKRLKVFDLSYSKKLIQTPEFSSMSNLEKLILPGCVNLIDIHPSIGVLKKLTTLILRRCDKLKGLPSSISNLESLIILDLYECSSFEKFPEIQGSMRSLRYLFLSGTTIREIPSSIDLEFVKMLDLFNCSKFEKFPKNRANMKSLCELYLGYSAIKELPTSVANWESLLNLDLSHCSKFEKFLENARNMKCLMKLCLSNTAIKDLPDSIGDLESVEILDLSYCSKFEKFPEKGGNMKSLRELCLRNTAIKDLPDSIGDLKSLRFLDLSHCSKFEKFPEKGGNMKSLRRLFLRNTAIKDLSDSIGDLESLIVLDLSHCSKFEKFPEKGGNMKSLRKLGLRNTAIKDLSDSIGDLESLRVLDLSHCSKFEKFPEKGGNMKSLRKLGLRNTAIKDLSDSIGDLEYLRILDLSYCSKFEKFPEMKRGMKRLRQLNLRGTAIEELPTIDNLNWLRRLDIGECKNLRNLPDNIYKLEFLQIGAYDGRSKEDDTSMLRLCHLKWLESATDELKCWKLRAVIPESSGIPEWIRYQNLGNEVTIELPMNWYEDPDFLGFVVSSVYQPNPTFDDDDDNDDDDDYVTGRIYCQLNLHGNGSLFNDVLWCKRRGNFNDIIDQVCVWWYPKIAIPKEKHHKFTHFNALFWDACNVKKCGVNLIFAGGQHKHVPMLLDHLGNFGDNGLVVLEESNGNRKRSHDDSLPHAMEESQCKRLGAGPNTNISL